MNTDTFLPDDIRKAYLSTDYSFTDGETTIVMRLDGPNPELLSYLKKNNIKQWAFMTAWNPYSNEQTEEYNQGQQAELLEKLKDYKVCIGKGEGRDGVWSAEESVFVAGIKSEDAEYLGRDFGQYAILVNGENGEPELLVCPPRF